MISMEDYALAGVDPTTLSQKVDRFSDIVLVYLDDLLIRSSTPEDHLAHLRLVFAKLKACNLQLKFSKCHFFQKEIKYLGHILSSEGVRPDPSKLAVLQNWQLPTTVLGMQQFLGLANYFRKFVPNFSRIAAPLYQLTTKLSVKPPKGSKVAPLLAKKGVDILLSGEEARARAFNTIKQLLSNPPILRYPDPAKPYTVISDASITGCGAILLQEDHPIAYYSYKFSTTERNYGTGEQEMLGILKALTEWRCYLEGCEGLTVVTDHNPLTFFSVQPNLTRRQARWQEKLSRFHPFKVVHRPGATNPADPLSRLYERPDALQEDLEENKRICLSLFAVTLSEFQFDSDLLKKIKEASQTDEYLLDPENQAKFTLEDEGYWTLHGLIIVPKELQNKVMELHHDEATSGHLGTAKTLDLIQRHFWWPNMKESVQEYCKTCDSCQKNKSSRQKPFGLLSPLDVPDTRWETVTMDFIMDLPLTSAGHNALMVIVDKLTKYAILIPCKTTCTAVMAAQLFVKYVWCSHGLPKRIISDRDKLFTSKFWKGLMKSLKVNHRYSTAYHPQTDGQTEVMNKVVEEVVRHFLNESGKNWEDLIPLVQFSINNSKNQSTGYTPFYLNKGSHPLSPASVLVPMGELPVLDSVLSGMQDALTIVKQTLVAAQDRQKHYADKKRSPHHFDKGQKVLLSTKHIRFRGKIRKFQNKYIGPFTITEKIGENAVRLNLPATYSRIHPVFHVSLLREYHSRPEWEPLPAPPPDILEEDSYYKIEQILSHEMRKVGKKHGKAKYKPYYLIQWEGYGPVHNSWEPEENLNEEALLSYKAKQPSLHEEPSASLDVDLRGNYRSHEVVPSKISKPSRRRRK
jgi:hypothetical protein